MPAKAPVAIAHPSPNFGPRVGEKPVDTIVIHYTDTRDAAEALRLLSDPAREVSAHYLIDEDGTVYALVDEAMRAWHAGLSYWRGVRDVNSRSIGIELQNPGLRYGYRAFPGSQMQALYALCSAIKRRWPIEDRNIVGHSDIAPDRKADPGPLFDWRALARAGHGIWPEPDGGDEGGDEDGKEGRAEDGLSAVGYNPDCSRALAAFQMHYRPRLVDNLFDRETAALLAALLRRLNGGVT